VTDRFRTRGHEAALRAIGHWIAAEQAPHALLLAGPPNVGKTTLATDLAAGLLCLDSDPARRPCWSCIACRKIERGVHPDVRRLVPDGPGGQIRIAAARALGAELALLPAEGRRRIAIVSSAERVNEDAQNALLKTLEEPPADVVIALCASDEEPILPTVRSRCVRLYLAPLGPRELTALLVEREAADPARAARIARLAAGRPGVAFVLAAQPDLERTLGRVARRLLDLTGADRRTRLGAARELLADGTILAGIDDMAETARSGASTGRGAQDAAADNAMSATISTAEAGVEAEAASTPTALAPSQRRRAFAALLDVWRDVARDLAVVASGARDRVRWVDLVDELDGVAKTLDAAEVARSLDRLERVSALVAANANPELALDAMLLAWPRAGEGVSRREHAAQPATVAS
jgi:DNA polymerase-3 subunit delta'